MHQQVVLGVGLLAHLLDDPGGHWEGRDARRAHHGVNLVLGGEEIQHLDKQHSHYAVQYEGHKTQHHDHQGSGLDKLVGLHGEGDGDTQQKGDEIGQLVLGSLGEAAQNAALPDQIAEHQKAYQGHRGGGHQTGHHRDQDGEQDAQTAGNSLGLVGHVHGPVLPGGHQLDSRGLDDGDQGHIGIGRHGDGPHIVGLEHLGNQDRGGTVRRADDADRGRVLQVKAQHRGNQDGQEDTRLGRGAAQKQLGVGQQGTKIDHGSDADKQQDGHGLAGLDAHFKKPLNDAVGLAHAFAELVDNAGQGQVHQDRTKAHWHQKRGLKPLFDGKPDQSGPHPIHKQLLPGDGQQSLPQEFHSHIPFLSQSSLILPPGTSLELRGSRPLNEKDLRSLRNAGLVN